MSSSTVPGIYFEPKPREPELPFVRTDVAGFIGFEPRVRDGASPSRLTGGSPPSGHSFQVDVQGFLIDVDDFRVDVEPAVNFTLSASSGSTLLADGESVAFGLAAVDAGVRLLVVSGAPSVNAVAAPTEHIKAAARSASGGNLPFGRIADITVARAGANTNVTVKMAGSPRVRDAASRFIGSPPSGHSFQVDVDAFPVVIGGFSMRAPAVKGLTLSSSAVTPLLADGESIVFTLTGVRTPPRLVSAQGSVVATGPRPAPAPADAMLDAAVVSALGGARRWRRISDIEYIRTGDNVLIRIRPALPPVPCDDFRDYVKQFGEPADDGAFLGSAVRAYFANGAARCWVSTVQRPRFDDAKGLELARAEMIGEQGASEETATGLERLLLIFEVSVIDAPDLYARRVVVDAETASLPPSKSLACFRDCKGAVFGSVTATAARSVESLEPLYDDAQVFDAQRQMLLRVAPDRWRALLLLTPPVELDPSDGKFHGPSPQKAVSWRAQFDGLLEDVEMSCAALYFPWLLNQEKVDSAVVEMPPTSFVAGVIARRDLARGAHISPANETLRAVVGLTRIFNDDLHGELYAPPRNINVLRAFAGYGIQVWGVRTLSADLFLRYVPVRRCLSAIERRVSAALEPVVFEPNTPLLWLRITQIVFHVLTPLFESGALRGERADQAFFVRCDATNNPPESIQQGRLLVEIGVAIAAPAEFIVFRLGRREGVVEVLE